MRNRILFFIVFYLLDFVNFCVEYIMERIVLQEFIFTFLNKNITEVFLIIFKPQGKSDITTNPKYLRYKSLLNL